MPVRDTQRVRPERSRRPSPRRTGNEITGSATSRTSVYMEMNAVRTVYSRQNEVERLFASVTCQRRSPFWV
ncbi:hypothetical protein PISMIDRAFT_235305 [Pisolithus microcarpus 441]|uniref:Uncharacterized protein n=1 Tax=Pisolithus microcarpus 441 TaxID=765257 RepID=A0A0C9ZB56_9AGAM|nr:hypothetical protein PISMIDRAFT_235305 [Pisolithus microcarpus 441]